MSIRVGGEAFRQAGYSAQWQQASSFNPRFGRSSNWLDSLNLKKAPIEANSSQTFSDWVGTAVADNSGADITYFTAYKCEFYITEIEFKGYGIMSFDAGQMGFNFEGYMN